MPTAKPSNLKDTLNVTNEELYPSISTVLLMHVLYTMPASTATTERSFSVLRRLKTYLRTTMMQDRLTSLAVLHVHRDIDIDIESCAHLLKENLVILILATDIKFK